MGPLTGGADPGATGFEAYAIGDLTGDHVLFGTFTIAGRVDLASKTISLTEVHANNYDE